jgi:hypothetical protein
MDQRSRRAVVNESIVIMRARHKLSIDSGGADKTDELSA